MATRFILYLSLLAAVFLFGLLNPRMLSLPFKILCVVVGITLVSEAASGFLNLRGYNNMPVYHFLSCIEYAGTALVFHGLLRSARIKKLVIYSIIPVAVIGIMNSVFLQDMRTFPSNILLLSHGIFLILSLLLFKQMLEEPVARNLFRQGEFWIAGAYLLFSSAVFLSFGLQNYFKRNQLNLEPLNHMIYFTNILFYTLLGIALYTEQSHNKETFINEQKQ